MQRSHDGGSEVFVVRPDNRIAVQSLRTGAVHGGKWVITDGLKAGDRVVVEGFQKFAAGDEVKPLPLREVATGSVASDDSKVTPVSVSD